jgi:protein involved in polysaccharide export with SLBB domain
MVRPILLFCAALAASLTMAQAAVIKTGMTLNIVVKGDQELSKMVRVLDNGTIDYPLLQDVSVTNKTTTELQDLLTYKLARVLESPLVLVSVVTETPMVVQVLGQVKKPGLLTAPPGASLQEVLLLAQGVTDQADLQKVKLVRRGEGDERAAYYDLQRFLNTGDLNLLPKLADGDKIIVLTSKKSRYVKVLGAVNKPGFFPVTESSGLFDLLYLAGGPTADANLSKVRVISSPGGQRADYVLDVQKFIDDGKTENLPMLGEGDVLIVYAKTVTWGKALVVVRDVVTLVTAWLVISQLTKS